MKKLKGIQEVVLLQIFLQVYVLLLHKNKELIFPSISSVDSNWFPLNCGSYLTRYGCATPLEELRVLQAGAGTWESTWAAAKMLQCKVFSHHHMLSLLLQMVLPSPLSFSLLPSPLPSLWTFPRPNIHWGDAAVVQREVRAGSGLRYHVHRKPKLVVCACLTKLRTWEW